MKMPHSCSVQLFVVNIDKHKTQHMVSESYAFITTLQYKELLCSPKVEMTIPSVTNDLLILAPSVIRSLQ